MTRRRLALVLCVLGLVLAFSAAAIYAVGLLTIGARA
jgi:hypothetical protein